MLLKEALICVSLKGKSRLIFTEHYYVPGSLGGVFTCFFFFFFFFWCAFCGAHMRLHRLNRSESSPDFLDLNPSSSSYC